MVTGSPTSSKPTRATSWSKLKAIGILTERSIPSRNTRTARQTGSPRRAQEIASFNGVYRVQSGTGKFAGAFGGGNLDYGEINSWREQHPGYLSGALAK
jgi:hypothetical protein